MIEGGKNNEIQFFTRAINQIDPPNSPLSDSPLEVTSWHVASTSNHNSVWSFEASKYWGKWLPWWFLFGFLRTLRPFSSFFIIQGGLGVENIQCFWMKRGKNKVWCSAAYMSSGEPLHNFWTIHQISKIKLVLESWGHSKTSIGAYFLI